MGNLRFWDLRFTKAKAGLTRISRMVANWEWRLVRDDVEVILTGGLGGIRGNWRNSRRTGLPEREIGNGKPETRWFNRVVTGEGEKRGGKWW